MKHDAGYKRKCASHILPDERGTGLMIVLEKVRTNNNKKRKEGQILWIVQK